MYSVYFFSGYKGPNGKFWKFYRAFGCIISVSTNGNHLNFAINSTWPIIYFFRNKNKTLKKFTLRPAKFVVGRPVSPDSPSLDVEDECGDISKPIKILDSPDSRTVEIDFPEINEDFFEESAVNASQVNLIISISFNYCRRNDQQ